MNVRKAISTLFLGSVEIKTKNHKKQKTKKRFKFISSVGVAAAAGFNEV